MANMTYWAKKNPEKHAEVLTSKGSKRKEYLESFLVLQSREKKARTMQTTSRSSGTETRGQTEKGWWSDLS